MSVFPRLAIDPCANAERICAVLRSALANTFGRRGYVVALSGGIDSAVTTAVAVRAVGAERVFCLCLPERESDPQSLILARAFAARRGVACEVHDITALLEVAGCYARRDEAIRRVVPEYGAGWKCKLALSRDAPQHDRLNLTSLVVERPGGERRTVRLRASVFRQIVAATNFKQRVRAMMTYYHADRLHFAVAGTPNRLEFDQGFFVKGGDGLADIKPLAHLYKAQVYELGEFLGVSKEILSRAPTTDTYSLPQSQEEFYFSLDPVVIDRLLLDFNMRRTVEEASRASGLAVDEVQWIWNDFRQKRARTRYLHLPAVLTEAVELSEQVEERSG